MKLKLKKKLEQTKLKVFLSDIIFFKLSNFHFEFNNEYELLQNRINNLEIN